MTRASVTTRKRQCEWCGNEFHLRHIRHAGRFCSRPCFYQGTRGANSHLWRGGRSLASGYVRVLMPDHPHAYTNGQVPEHRVVMEGVLGRYLEPHETVHHINGDTTDNRAENLQLRTGRHGKGISHRCGDCGSMNIVSVAIGEKDC